MRSETKAFPKYKQEAFKQIHNVIYGILKRGGFFDMYPQLVDDPGISLYYSSRELGGSVDTSGTFLRFSVWTRQGHLFNLKGSSIVSLLPVYNRKLTDEEYRVISKNIEVLFRLSGTRFYVASKVGKIQEFTVSNRGCEFKGESGITYTEFKR